MNDAHSFPDESGTFYRPGSSAPMEARGNWTVLLVPGLLYGILLYLFVEAASFYSSIQPYRHVSPALFVVDWMFLYIHEGGHFLFSFFGRTMTILGGSFWQVMFPVLSFGFALRDSPTLAPVPLYFTGHNLMSVSHYMLDAPMRQLRLLGGDKSRHDWHNLFNTWDVMEHAESIAGITYWIGWIACIAAIAAGLYFGFRDYWKPTLRSNA